MKKCPKCGELSEPQFDSCWKCGHDFSNSNAEKPISAEKFSRLVEMSVPKKKKIETDSRWWLGATISPFITAIIGFIFAMNVHVAQGDMIGSLPIFCLGLGLLVGVILWLVFTVISIVKKEKYSAVPFFVAAIVLLFFGGLSLIRR